MEPASFFLACEHFPGSHTSQATANKLNKIFFNYEIIGKVFFITTDGASDNVAALKHFGDNYRSIKDYKNTKVYEDFCVENGYIVESEDPPEEDDNYDDDTESTYSEDPELVREDPFINSQLGFVADRYSDPIPDLPNMNRVSCSSHLLDKVTFYFSLITFFLKYAICMQF